MAATVRKYLTQDLSDDEKRSYLEYVIKGDKSSTEWIGKALARRMPILTFELQCNTEEEGIICNEWVNIYETGVCKCNKGHSCYDQVLESIDNLT